MKKRVYKLVALSILLPMFAAVASDSQIRPSALITAQTWKDVRALTVTNRNPADTDMSELLARLVLTEKGEDLSDEAWQRTIARANNPHGGFGWTSTGGAKRLFAVYIMMINERNARIKQLEVENVQQQALLNELRAEIAELRARIDKNGK